MIRSSYTYRRLWHYRKRNTGTLHIYFIILAIVFFLAAIASYANSALSPYVAEIVQVKTRSVVTDVINDTFIKEFGGNIKYNDLAIVQRDDKNRIVSIEVNTVKLNEITARITSNLKTRLSKLREERVAVPAGALTGIQILSGEGPDVYIKIIPAEDIDVEFVSDFSNIGGNQTRHRIYLEVRARVALSVPMARKETTAISTIPVAETIILGNIPEPYISAWKSIRD